MEVVEGAAGGGVIENAPRRLAAGRQLQAVFVVLEQQVPGFGVAGNEPDEFAPGVADEGRIGQAAGEQVDGLAGFVEAFFQQAGAVERVALREMFAQHAGSPLAEAHATL